MRLKKIKWNKNSADSILFVPAMLDMHFPLIKYAFFSKDYYPVVMSEEEGITDVDRVRLLMPTSGYGMACDVWNVLL